MIGRVCIRIIFDCVYEEVSNVVVKRIDFVGSIVFCWICIMFNGGGVVAMKGDVLARRW